ncbi:MAG: hypothetical protein IIA89_13815 [Chloroflexi bacterium]|nr:hypothetical protein [Chloroflexota bacterium]
MSGIPIDEGSEQDVRSLKLSSKTGNWIRNVRKIARPPAAMVDAESYAHAQCPGIATRSLSSTYNCAGLVFASRRTVILMGELNRVLREDEFRPVTQKAQLKPGDLVTYKVRLDGEVRHIGVVMSTTPNPEAAEVDVTVLSQWGYDGEYIHDEENVPVLFGQIREYFTERRTT